MEAFEKIAASAATAIISGAAGWFSGKIAAARAAGKQEAEFKALQHTVETQNEILHNRVSKMQTEFNLQLSELNARTIELLKQGSKLEGIILGKGAQ